MRAMVIQNVRLRLAQVPPLLVPKHRVSGWLRFRLSSFRNIVVAGPKGPAYKGCQDTCRRVL